MGRDSQWKDTSRAEGGRLGSEVGLVSGVTAHLGGGVGHGEPAFVCVDHGVLLHIP